MKTLHHSDRARKIVLLALALLPFAYVGSYFAVPALPSSLRLPSFLAAHASGVHTAYVAVNGQWQAYPDYRGLPEWLFAPVHNYDRTHLRPALWGGSYPRNEELSFDWLLGPLASSAKQKSP